MSLVQALRNLEVNVKEADDFILNAQKEIGLLQEGQANENEEERRKSNEKIDKLHADAQPYLEIVDGRALDAARHLADTLEATGNDTTPTPQDDAL